MARAKVSLAALYRHTQAGRSSRIAFGARLGVGWRAMADLDQEQHQVVFRVAVIGSVGQRFLEKLPLKEGELELGAVAGYHPRFVFQQFPADPWADDGSSGAALEALVPNLDALVLTDDFATGTHYSGSGVERLSKVLAPIKLRIPSAIFGGPALAEEWGSLSG